MLHTTKYKVFVELDGPNMVTKRTSGYIHSSISEGCLLARLKKEVYQVVTASTIFRLTELLFISFVFILVDDANYFPHTYSTIRRFRVKRQW